MRINNVIFELFSHATEDVEEVKKCLINSIPLKLRSRVGQNMEIKAMEGHFKESIMLIQLKLKNKDAELYFEHLITNLNVKLKIEDFLNRYDETQGNFYMRIDKQAIYNSDSQLLLIDKGDVIKIKVHFQGFPLKTDKLIKFLTENKYIVK